MLRESSTSRNAPVVLVFTHKYLNRISNVQSVFRFKLANKPEGLYYFRLTARRCTLQINETDPEYSGRVKGSRLGG
jgi:hypothetical protein